MVVLLGRTFTRPADPLLPGSITRPLFHASALVHVLCPLLSIDLPPACVHVAATSNTTPIPHRQTRRRGRARRCSRRCQRRRPGSPDRRRLQRCRNRAAPRRGACGFFRPSRPSPPATRVPFLARAASSWSAPAAAPTPASAATPTSAAECFQMRGGFSARSRRSGFCSSR